MKESLELVELTEDLYASFCELADDFMAERDDRYAKNATPGAFASLLAKYERCKQWSTVPDGLVPSFYYYLRRSDGKLLGGIRFRPELNEGLLIEGGNIGYDVGPSYRCNGMATLMLQMVLDRAREHGLDRVLITCFDDNTASERVIRKCGGVLESTEPSPRNGKMTRRYWIGL